MPWSALPPHIDEPHEWNNKDDDDHWYTKWRKSVKGWFAFGPRCTEWWAKFRYKPVTLFAFFGGGEARWENDFMAIRSTNNTVVWYFPAYNGFYLSRIQRWCDWHIQLGWPLFFAFHFKYGKTGLINFYIGFKRDADIVYWLALYLGTHFK